MTLISDIRVDTGDDGATQRYSDAQIIALLTKASRRLNRELGFTQNDGIIIDSSGNLTSSDPDGFMYDLMLLQTECLMSKRDFTSDLNSGGAGIFIHDGEQSIDNRNAASTRTSFFDSKNSPCEELKKALDEEKLRRSADYGKLIW